MWYKCPFISQLFNPDLNDLIYDICLTSCGKYLYVLGKFNIYLYTIQNLNSEKPIYNIIQTTRCNTTDNILYTNIELSKDDNYIELISKRDNQVCVKKSFLYWKRFKAGVGKYFCPDILNLISSKLKLSN